jgi:hypothetical protein
MKTHGKTLALVLVAGATLAACSESAPDSQDAPSTAVTVTVEPEPDPTETAVTDPDQVRYYEAMRGAAGWEDTSDANLDEIAAAACTDLRTYTGAPSIAVTSMEFTFGEQLGDDTLGKAAVSALIKRWCPDVLE